MRASDFGDERNATRLAGRQAVDIPSLAADTLGLLLVVLVLPASVQDRDGAKRLLLELRNRQHMSRTCRRVRHLFVDSGSAGKLLDWAHTLLNTTIEIVRKPPGQKGFAVIPPRPDPAHDISPHHEDLKHALREKSRLGRLGKWLWAPGPIGGRGSGRPFAAKNPACGSNTRHPRRLEIPMPSPMMISYTSTCARSVFRVPRNHFER